MSSPSTIEITLIVVFAGFPIFCFLWIFTVFCYHLIFIEYCFLPYCCPIRLPRITLLPPNTPQVDWGITVRPMMVQELAFYAGKPLGTFTPVVVIIPSQE